MDARPDDGQCVSGGGYHHPNSQWDRRMGNSQWDRYLGMTAAMTQVPLTFAPDYR